MDGKQQGVHAAAAADADYADSLEPGYRFCPTDSELIVFYLKPKIEKQIHPRCRFYDVNIYDYHPKELAEEYQSCEDKWYFLTPRKPRYLNGKRPNRQTKDFGTWKASQKYTTVYDDNVIGRVVGMKRSLAYFEEHKNKTQWLMHEYTTTENKMSDCVLCKIYKKETSETNNDRAIQHKNTRNQEENNQEPSPIRRRISGNQQENNQQNEPQQVQINQEVNHYLGTNAQMMAASALGFMPNVNQQYIHDNIDTRSGPTGSHQPFPAQASTGDQSGFGYNHGAIVSHATTNSSPNPITVPPIAMSTLLESCQGVVTGEVFGSSTCEYYQNQSVSASMDSIGTSNSFLVDPFSMTSKDEIVQHQYSVKSSPNQSMEVPQVDDEDDGFDEIRALLDKDNAEEEIDKDSNQSMEVPKDNDEDEIAKLMARFDEDDAEDEIDKNSKQSMEVAEHDVANELDKVMAPFEDKDVSSLSFSRSSCVEVFSLDDLFSR